MKKLWRISVAFLILVASPADEEAFAGKYLYHATRKAFAGKILKKGFSPSKMKSNSRFGAGVYLSLRKTTARAEKASAGTILRMKTGRSFEKRVWNLNRPKTRDLHSVKHIHGLRGAIKKDVIGPKLGHRLGAAAGRRGEVIRYRSAREPKGINYFIPRRTFNEHPRIIHKVQAKTSGRYH